MKRYYVNIVTPFDTFLLLSTPDYAGHLSNMSMSRNMLMYLVIFRLDMSHSVVPKLVVMMGVPSRYMMVAMADTRVHREMRSSHGGSDKEGEEKSSCLDSHGWRKAWESLSEQELS